MTFIDSTGLGLLYGLRKHQQAHDGRIALAGASPMLVKLLHITGMDEILPLLHDTPDEIYQAPDAAGERAGTAAGRDEPAAEEPPPPPLDAACYPAVVSTAAFGACHRGHADGGGGRQEHGAG